MSDLVTKHEQRVWYVIDKLADRDKVYVDSVYDLITFGYYGPDVFSQFGLGLQGYVFRQSLGAVKATVKVVESGVPLVGFVTSATTNGCIEQMFDLLFVNKLKWQRDKFPWI